MKKIEKFQITGMTISSFKSYQEPTKLVFGNPTTITGGNGQGKTSIADAIAFAITGLPFFGERDVFLSIFNPLYFIEELGDEGKNLLEMYLPMIPHETVMEQLADGVQAALEGVEIPSPNAVLKSKCAESV